MKFHTLRFIPASNRYIKKTNMGDKHTSHLPDEEILHISWNHQLLACIKSRIPEEIGSKLA